MPYFEPNDISVDLVFNQAFKGCAKSVDLPQFVGPLNISIGDFLVGGFCNDEP